MNADLKIYHISAGFLRINSIYPLQRFRNNEPISKDSELFRKASKPESLDG